jgi:hypothetical protein
MIVQGIHGRGSMVAMFGSIRNFFFFFITLKPRVE